MIRNSIAVTFPILLAQHILAGNVLVYCGGCNPYQAVYGRQPALLPDLQAEGPEQGETVGDYSATARVREIALGAMIQATTVPAGSEVQAS